MTFDDSIVFLFVDDLDRSSSFYQRLGLEVMIDQGTCHILGAGGRTMVGVCGGREASPQGVIVTLVTSDVESKCGQLRDAGVVFEQPPIYNPEYNITHALLRDPDGYLVEIQRFEANV